MNFTKGQRVRVKEKVWPGAGLSGKVLSVRGEQVEVAIEIPRVAQPASIMTGCYQASELEHLPAEEKEP